MVESKKKITDKELEFFKTNTVPNEKIKTIVSKFLGGRSVDFNAKWA